MKNDSQNFLIAMALSIMVLIGWHYFYAGPQIEEAKRKTAQQQASTLPAANGSQVPVIPSTTSPLAPNVTVVQPREQVLTQSPRITIDTPTLQGTLALKGARIDDLVFKKYHETVDPKSEKIRLFSPSGTSDAYYAEFGWIGATTLKVPDASTVWSASNNTLTPQTPLTLTYDNGEGITFTRTVEVDNNAMFTIKDTVAKASGENATLFPYGLISRHGKPKVEGFYILHEGLIGVPGEHNLQEFTYDSIVKEAPLTPTSRGKIWKAAKGGFVGITDKYWASAIIPDQNTTYDARFSTATTAPVSYQTDILGAPITLTAGTPITSTQRLFAGAKEVATIDGYEETLGIKRFELLIDWGWFHFITKPLFKGLNWFRDLTGNFGIAILIVTVLLKLVFFPLANKSYASMAKMKAVQPEMTALRERYADDRMKQQTALMELYKREKINPLAGCWPVLIQIPVFFALYKVLFVTIEMRHAPFYGWIKDLAAPDPTSIFNLFGLIPVSLPAFLTVGVWPILMGITMFVQMKMNPEPTDPIQKTMFTWMPLIFTFMLAAFPAGLVIYWTWNNLLSVLQQGYIMKKQGTKIELFDNLKGLFRRKSA
jgi:YidC/Oxa1 family membrane protein insertase